MRSWPRGDLPPPPSTSPGTLLGNAALSSILVRIVDGGMPVRGLTDVTVLVWISHVTAYGSQQVLQSFIGDRASL